MPELQQPAGSNQQPVEPMKKVTIPAFEAEIVKAGIAGSTGKAKIDITLRLSNFNVNPEALGLSTGEDSVLGLMAFLKGHGQNLMVNSASCPPTVVNIGGDDEKD